MPSESENHEFQIYFLSEKAISVEFRQEISDENFLRIKTLNQCLNQKPFDGFLTSIPAYATLTIVFDPVLVIRSPGLSGRNCFERVSNFVKGINYSSAKISGEGNAVITIPVCYGGEFGPDLAELSRQHAMDQNDVIRLHTSAVYRVFMIGSVPGFAYMGGLPDILNTPRRASPREKVEAGAVGIAGKQTGIYPSDSPGGWQIIGRTPLKMFDVKRLQPSLLKSGDNVTFEAISMVEFIRIAEQENGDTNS